VGFGSFIHNVQGGGKGETAVLKEKGVRGKGMLPTITRTGGKKNKGTDAKGVAFTREISGYRGLWI